MSDKEVALASFTSTPPAVRYALISVFSGVVLASVLMFFGGVFSAGQAVSMIQAVLPSSFQSSGIVNVTIIQDNSVTEALLCDSSTYYLYKKAWFHSSEVVNGLLAVGIDASGITAFLCVFMLISIVTLRSYTDNGINMKN